jgi:sugar/nucleoside kinase (ribokinase family)
LCGCRISILNFSMCGGDYEGRANALMAAGMSLVVVTHGINGAQAWHRAAGRVKVEAPTIDVVDTIGAGDSFQAALLFAPRAIGRIMMPERIKRPRTRDSLKQALQRALVANPRLTAVGLSSWLALPVRRKGRTLRVLGVAARC